MKKGILQNSCCTDIAKSVFKWSSSILEKLQALKVKPLKGYVIDAKYWNIEFVKCNPC